jgi:hypothetical protein
MDMAIDASNFFFFLHPFLSIHKRSLTKIDMAFTSTGTTATAAPTAPLTNPYDELLKTTAVELKQISERNKDMSLTSEDRLTLVILSAKKLRTFCCLWVPVTGRAEKNQLGFVVRKSPYGRGRRDHVLACTNQATGSQTTILNRFCLFPD